MKRKYNLGQQCMSYILLVSLFLQSCTNFPNPIILIPIEEAQDQQNRRDNSHALAIQIFLKQEDKKILAQGGHAVSFYQEAGQWEATVEENLPEGFSRRLALPVYGKPNFSNLEALSKHKPTWRKDPIHVCFPEKALDGKEYVYIGKMGLMGGGKRREKDEIGPKNKKVKNKSEKEVGKYGMRSHEEIGKSAKRFYQEEISLPTPGVFTSDKGLTYQVFKNITLEIAKEVEAQTGLVIAFESDESTTDFIIGKRNFRKLRLGKEQSSGQYCGIKILSPNLEDLAEARAEANLQFRLNGLPHLMPLVDAGETNEDDNNSTILYQVMPLAALGNGADLATYLQTIQDPAFKEAILVHVAKNILQSFTAMHNLSEPIAHLDFKPDNLVIDKQGKVYIIEFGDLAYLDAKGDVQRSSTEKVEYFSPERYQCIQTFTSHFNAKASDSWAIGLTLLEMAIGMLEDKVYMVTNDPAWYFYTMLEQAAPGSYAYMVKGFLNPDEKQRLTPEQALSLPIFQQETRAEVLTFLKQFVQTMQWNKRKEKMAGKIPGLTSVQQLPLPHLGENYTGAGKTLRNLGGTYLLLGNYEKGKELLEKALKINMEHFGADHAETGITLNDLGNAYGGLGDYAKQKEIFEKALVINIKHYGEDDPSIGMTLDNLGNAYGDLGDYGKKKELLEKALLIKIKNYGEDHPETGITLDNLGNAYGDLGDYAKKKELLEKALVIKIKNYGEDHSQTGITLANLGNAYGGLGDYAEQKWLLEKALVITIKNSGEDHPSTGITLTNLGNAYGSLRDYAKQKEIFEKALVIMIKQFGENHPSTGKTLASLGNAYGSLGDYAKQKELLEKALVIMIKNYEEDHPQTGITLDNLGNAYGSLGDYAKQKELLEKALVIMIKNYGEEYPSTGITLTNLGNAYGSLGDYAKQKELLEKALVIMIKNYGEDHSQTGMTLTNLGNAYGGLGDREKVLKCYQQAYNIFVTHKHPHAATVKRWIDALTQRT